jgi:hypothetical protein
LHGHRFGWRQGVALLLATLAVLGPLLVLTSWTWGELTGPHTVARGAAGGLPAVAADAAGSADRTRTLVLRADSGGAIIATAARGDGERLDATSTLVQARHLSGGLHDATPAEDPATVVLGDAVAALAGESRDAREALTGLGVGFVLLLDPSGAEGTPVDAGSLDAVPGLTRAGEVPGGVLWRVTPASGEGPAAVDRAARVRVLAADGTPQAVLPSDRVDVDTRLPAGPDGRLLVLAERAHPGWSATLDGRALRPALHDGWAQAFELPPAGGELVVAHRAPWSGAWSAAQLAVLVLTALLAVPVSGSRREGGR